jgi:hypothetical protein
MSLSTPIWQSDGSLEIGHLHPGIHCGGATKGVARAAGNILPISQRSDLESGRQQGRMQRKLLLTSV